MADEQDSLLKQIEEEVRREQLAKLWDKYGVVALGVVAAILLVFGGWRLYQSEAIKAAKRAGAQFAEASELLADPKLPKEKKADALQALKTMAKSGPTGYAVLAEFKLAARARAEDKPDEAVKHYQVIAANSSADDLLRGFARLQIASLKLDNGSFTDVKNQLNDLVKSDSPWRHSAREILGLAALKAGKLNEARQAFQSLLIDGETPSDIAERAHVAMAMVARGELAAKQPKESGGTKLPNNPTNPDKAQPAKSEKPKPKDGATTPSNAKTQ
jgi:hypothetical protein